MKLHEVDLTPIRETIVDLLGRQTVEGWRPFGDTYSSRVGEALTDNAHEKTLTAFALAERVTKTTKENLIAFLEARGIVGYSEEKRSALKSRVMCALYDAWFPRRFINPAESIYVGCACGFEGHAERIAGSGQFACGGCGKSGYLQLRAMRDWYVKRTG